MTYFKQQLNLFYIALGFLTRLPAPQNLDFNQSNLNQASRYFSLIGWLVGLLCALTYLILDIFLPANIAIVFSMLVSVLLTGCFHEDGLADTCDGLGGGWNQEQKLNIMKDSRLGTYGATGLWFVLTIKFLLLSHISLLGNHHLLGISYVAIALIMAHPISRAISSILIFILPYVRSKDSSKVKPLAEKQSVFDLSINLLIGALALFLVPSIAFSLIIGLLILVITAKIFLIKQIKGFTGDVLGAIQQITELLIYLMLLIGVMP